MDRNIFLNMREDNLPMKERLKKHGIIREIAIFFLISIIITGMVTWLTQYIGSSSEVRYQVEKSATGVAQEVREAITEFPSYTWLLDYWYENYENLDIEYDADFYQETETYEKFAEFTELHPDILLEYATEEQVRSLSEEDQKLFAEIAYSWLITKVNEIKSSFNVDYLYGVVTEEPFDEQFFLFSAADPGAVRGTNYEEVYTLGVQVTVSEGQRVAMKNTIQDLNHLVEAGDYMDYYEYFETVHGHSFIIGETFNTEDMSSQIGYDTLRGTALSIIMQLIFSVICIFLIVYFIINPLMDILLNIRKYTEDKNSEDIIRNLSKIQPPNEIGQLSDDVSTLAAEMDDYYKKLEKVTKDTERIKTELELASRIQLSMLPSSFPAFPDHSEFDLYARMTPAKAVGGDFYDFFMIDDDHLCLIIADVSGKGVPASLFMMASDIIFESRARGSLSTAKIMKEANESISNNNKEEMFVTVWLGILELSTGKLTYTNAGHNYPAVKNGSGDFEYIEKRHGFIVGGMKGINYKEDSMILEPGSKIFMYTDGVTEAVNDSQEMYGSERVLDVLNRNKDAEDEEIINNISESLDAFVNDAEQFDDITIMSVTYYGKNGKTV